jgi:hypothetical protein
MIGWHSSRFPLFVFCGSNGAASLDSKASRTFVEIRIHRRPGVCCQPVCCLFCNCNCCRRLASQFYYCRQDSRVVLVNAPLSRAFLTFIIPVFCFTNDFIHSALRTTLTVNSLLITSSLTKSSTADCRTSSLSSLVELKLEIFVSSLHAPSKDTNHTLLTLLTKSCCH